MKRFAVIQKMLNEAKKHNLEMECLVTMIACLVPNLTVNQLQKACDESILQWDL
jgi:hypothetical protein